MSRSARIITLTTDFGRVDTYVGQMKGVVLSIAPDVRIVDLTHDVPAHDVEAGAFALDVGYRVFPADAIHVAVVDPGVGTTRPAIAVETIAGTFVGPDNGVLGRALRGRDIVRAHRIDEERYRRVPVGATFEGRDRFAPAAAWIATGTPIDRLGPEAHGVAIASAVTAPAPGDDPIAVPVVHVDRFGNVVLDLARPDLPLEPRAPGSTREQPLYVEVSGHPVISRLCRVYGEAPEGEPFLLFNSADLLEIAMREQRADRHLGLRRGDRTRVGVR